jgi:repressor LexA
LLHERVFDRIPERVYAAAMAEQLTARQRGILDMIETSMRERGYPPSVREIGEAVGLTSPSTVHSHLATLQRLGYLKRDPTKPRAIEVRFDPSSGAAIERRPVRHVPLVGDVAAAPTCSRRRTWKSCSRCRKTSPAPATCSCCGSVATR